MTFLVDTACLGEKIVVNSTIRLSLRLCGGSKGTHTQIMQSTPKNLLQRMCLVHNCTHDVAVQILSKRMLSYRQRLVLVLFHTKLNNFHQQHLIFINDLLQCTTFEEVVVSLRYWKQRWRPQNMLESIVCFSPSLFRQHPVSSRGSIITVGGCATN